MGVGASASVVQAGMSSSAKRRKMRRRTQRALLQREDRAALNRLYANGFYPQPPPLQRFVTLSDENDDDGARKPPSKPSDGKQRERKHGVEVLVYDAFKVYILDGVSQFTMGGESACAYGAVAIGCGLVAGSVTVELPSAFLGCLNQGLTWYDHASQQPGSPYDIYDAYAREAYATVQQRTWWHADLAWMDGNDQIFTPYELMHLVVPRTTASLLRAGQVIVEKLTEETVYRILEGLQRQGLEASCIVTTLGYTFGLYTDGKRNFAVYDTHSLSFPRPLPGKGKASGAFVAWFTDTLAASQFCREYYLPSFNAIQSAAEESGGEMQMQSVRVNLLYLEKREEEEPSEHTDDDDEFSQYAWQPSDDDEVVASVGNTGGANNSTYLNGANPGGLPQTTAAAVAVPNSNAGPSPDNHTVIDVTGDSEEERDVINLSDASDEKWPEEQGARDEDGDSPKKRTEEAEEMFQRLSRYLLEAAEVQPDYKHDSPRALSKEEWQLQQEAVYKHCIELIAPLAAMYYASSHFVGKWMRYRVLLKERVFDELKLQVGDTTPEALQYAEDFLELVYVVLDDKSTDDLQRGVFAVRPGKSVQDASLTVEFFLRGTGLDIVSEQDQKFLELRDKLYDYVAEKLLLYAKMLRASAFIWDRDTGLLDSVYVGDVFFFRDFVDDAAEAVDYTKKGAVANIATALAIRRKGEDPFDAATVEDFFLRRRELEDVQQVYVQQLIGSEE